MSRVPVHKVFAWVWGVWLSWLMMGVFIIPNLWMDRAILLVFFILEMYTAIAPSKRDTLSEFMHWLKSWAKPGTAWYRSWNGLVVGLLSLITYQGVYVSSHGYLGEAWELPVRGAIVGGTIFFWNLYHWLRPSKYG